MALASGFPCAVLILAFLCETHFVQASSPPKRIWCVDKDCQEKLGEGVTLQAYSPIVDEFISFAKNEKVIVFGRTEKNDVLHVQVGEKRGYAPENVIKVDRLFVHKDKLIEVEVLSGLSSQTVSTDTTQATEVLQEPVATEATLSPAVEKSCVIYGTVMRGDICDDADASDVLAETEAVTQLESSVDSLPTPSLPAWSSSFTTDIKVDLPMDVGAKISPQEPAATHATLTHVNITQVDSSHKEGETAIKEQPVSSASSEVTQDSSDKLSDVTVEVEDEDDKGTEETYEKPIPGESDDDVEESAEQPSHSTENDTLSSGDIPPSIPLEMGLNASSTDSTVSSSLATPSLEDQRTEPLHVVEPLTSRTLFEQSSTSAGEALPSHETAPIASSAEEPAVTSSLTVPALETEQSSLLASSQGLSSSQLMEDASILATTGSSNVETVSTTSTVDESQVASSLVAPSPEQLQPESVTLAESTSSLLLPEQSVAMESASLKIGPGESSADKPAVSDVTTTLVEEHLPDQSSSTGDLSLTLLPSESQDSSTLATPASQFIEVGTVSSSIVEPAASQLYVPLMEQQPVKPLSAEAPLPALSLSPSLPAEPAVSLRSEAGLDESPLAEPLQSVLATPSLEPQRVDLTFTEDVLSSSSLLMGFEESPLDSAVSPTSLAPVAQLEPSVGVEPSGILPVEGVAAVPTAEALVSPSSLPADGLAAPPPVPTKEGEGEEEVPSEQPPGAALDWGVAQEYVWQILALVPEPLRAALDWPLLPPSLPLLLMCCCLLFASLVISLQAYWVHHRKASSLAGSLSGLEQRLFTLVTERQVLSEQLAQAKAHADRGSRTLSQQEHELDALREEVQSQGELVRQLRSRLSEQGQQLEAGQVALAMAQKALMEQETESRQRGETVAILEQQLQEACTERDLWRERATESQAQERSLQQSLCDATDTSDRLWSELEALKRRQEALHEEVSASNQEAADLAEQLKLKNDRIQVLEASLGQLELLQTHGAVTRGDGEAENEADEEEARKARLQQLLDAVQARRERDQVEEQRQQLQAQLDGLQEQLRTQQERAESLEKELETNAKVREEAERRSAEAQTKLEVLSNYFKDRELQLQKEVGFQEVERRQRETQASTATQQLAMLEQQCQSYRTQLSSLRQEMELSERNYKNQVADQEKRAHENWLAARAAERKLEEANRDRTALRQRLTLLERELQQPPPMPPAGDMFAPRPPLLSKDEAPLLDGPLPPLPPLDMMPPPFPPFPPMPPPPPPEMLKHMRMAGGSPHFFDMGPPMPPPPFVPRPGRSSQASLSSSASDSRGRPHKSSPQPLSADGRRNGTGGRSTPL
ncbi:uncharacterized protein LOC144104847 [Amblyomma americanum]